MKFQINTAKFQEMVMKASRGASNNRQILLTSLIGIELKDGELCLTTYDGTNYLFIKEQNVEGDDFYVTLEIDRLVKLVSKMTTENVTIELFDKYATIVGNGTYKFDVYVEGEGRVHFPNPVKADIPKLCDISLVDIKTILAGIKPSLATTAEIPFYMHYYVGDSVIGTDTSKASAYNKKLFEQPRLVNVNMMGLLDIMTEDTVEVYGDDTDLYFVTKDCSVYGVMPSGVDDYNVSGVNNLLTQEYPNYCKVAKADILGALDRIRLFVTTYDEGAILLHFTDKELTISSKLTTGVESVAYTQPIDEGVNFSCEIEVNSLFTQIHSQVSNVVMIEFGLEQVIKLVDEDIVSAIALFQ